MLLVGVGRIVAAAPAPLAQIRDQVAADWIAKQASDRARAVATAIAAKVARGMPLAEAVAGSRRRRFRRSQPFAARRIEMAQVPAAGRRRRCACCSRCRRARAGWSPTPRARLFHRHGGQDHPGQCRDSAGLIAAGPERVPASRAAQEYAEQFVGAIASDVGVKRNEKAIAAARARLISGGN